MKRLIVIALGCLALAGCTPAPSARPPEVATLRSPSANTSSAPATPDARPRERLDMTDAELEALNDPYNTCLESGGAPSKRTASRGKPKKSLSEADEAALEKACAHLRPLPPIEEDRQNPEAIDYMHRVASCMHAKGVRYVEVFDDPESGRVGIATGGAKNDEQSVIRGMEVIDDCRKEELHK